MIAPLVTLVVAAWLARLGPVNGRPIFGYASSFVLIIGASLLVPADHVRRGPGRARWRSAGVSASKGCWRTPT